MGSNLFRTGALGLFLCVALPSFAQCVSLFNRYDSLVIGEPGSGYALTSASPQVPFTAAADVTWFSLSKNASGGITITSMESNDAFSERIGHITISGIGICTKIIVIVQPGKTCLKGIDGTQGQKFWAAFIENMYPGSQEALTTDLVFAASAPTSGTITNPRTGWVSYFTVPARDIHTVHIPETQAYNTVGETVTNRAVYIETSADVSVYAANFQNLTSDAAVVLPVEALGDEYYSISFNGNIGQSGTNIGDDRAPEEFLIVATEDKTLVTIVPKNKTDGGKPAGDPYTIRLQKGQSYLVKSDVTGNTDSESNYVSITGSYIKSNKLIAVFGGHKRAHVGCDGNNSRDHLYEQLLPLRLWGTQYLVVPTNLTQDLFRVLAIHNNTRLSIGGVAQSPMNKGEYRDFSINQNQVTFIDADHPVSVALFAKSKDCTNQEIGDPFMIVLNPIQNLTKELTFSPLPSTGIPEHYVNITVKKQSKHLTRLVNERTGQDVALSFIDIPNQDYAYTKVPIAVAPHSLKNEAGFTAYAYGAGESDSYGYLVGARFNHLEEPEMVRDTAYCVNETLQPLSVFDGNDLLWYLTDNFETETGSPVAPVFTTDHPATYTYYVSYRKECSEGPRKKITIIVDIPPADPVISTLDAQSSTVFCQGESDILIVQSAGSGVVDWYRDNQKIAGVSSASLVVTKSGTYHARAATVNLCYATNPSNLVEVTVHELPGLLAISNTSICKNDAVPTVLVTPNGYTLLWYDENGQPTGEPLLQSATAETTTYYISQKSNITNCEGPAAKWVYTVNNLPTVTISGADYFCEDSTAELTALGAVDYLWSTGATSASVTINVVDAYHVIGTDHNGCKNTAYTSISERLRPHVVANNDTVVCLEREVTLGTKQHLGTLSWNTPQTVKVTERRTYTVTAGNECGTVSDDITVDIFPPIRFAPNPLPPYNYKKYYEQELLLENVAYPIYLRWLGSLPDGITLTADGILRGMPMVTDYDFNSHRFTLFLEDSHGCMATQEFVLTPHFSAPNVIVRDGGENSHFLPDFNLEIYNRQGVLIYKGRGWLGTSGASQVSPGTYFYKVNMMQDGVQHQYMGSITVLQ
jgi:hypothetical protein